ncbi:MAG: PASTA domain-containing protein [Clostridia bacterium]
MALIKCKECGKEISSNATACPSCGYKNINESEKAPFGILAICFFIPIIGIILFIINISNKPKYAKQCILAGLLPVIIIVVGLIVFYFIYFGTSVYLSATTPYEIEIPNVVGMTEEEAKQIIEEKSLKVEIKETFDNKVPKGYIVSQDPKYIEKYSVKEGSIVTIWVSK